MLKTSSCDYCDADILVSRNVTITWDPENATPANKRLEQKNRGEIFKNCAPFFKCVSKINNTQVAMYKCHVAMYMPMYNLIDCSDSCSKISESLLQYYRDIPNAILANTESYKCKVKYQ